MNSDLPKNLLLDRRQDWWAVPVKGEPRRVTVAEVRDRSFGGLTDVRVVLVREHPLIGRIAIFGREGAPEYDLGRPTATFSAPVRAIVQIDGKDADLLLEDWTGFPWVRVPLTAELLPECRRRTRE